MHSADCCERMSATMRPYSPSAQRLSRLRKLLSPRYLHVGAYKAMRPRQRVRFLRLTRHGAAGLRRAHAKIMKTEKANCEAETAMLPPTSGPTGRLGTE